MTDYKFSRSNIAYYDKFGQPVTYADVAAHHKAATPARTEKTNTVTQTQLQTLYKRDEGICWICNEVVPAPGTTRQTDPMRATRDHVIRRREGGTNRLSNLRLAHAKCNTERN